MVSPGLASRISRLKRAIFRLKKYTSMSLETLLEEDIIPALEREVQVAIQALLDIGEYIIAESGWESPQTYRDIAKILLVHEVLNVDEFNTLAQLAGLRNILVHVYTELDEEKIYSFAKELIEDAESLLTEMPRYVKK